MKRLAWPLRILGLIAVLAIIGFGVLWIAPSHDYILLPDKAQPVAPLLTVGGKHERAKDKGKIFFLAVLVRKASLLERLFPSIREGSTLVPESAIKPPGVSDKAQHSIDAKEMSRSQDVAAAVALRQLGYKVRLRNTGARIAAVFQDMPAARSLQADQVIVSVNGRPVDGPLALHNEMSKVHPGESVRVGVRTPSGLETVTLKTVADPRDAKRALIGVSVDQSGNVQLPFPVRIRPGGVVGPSAGLAFALEIMEKLGSNVDRGYRIAATGELELNGDILPIGGMKQKAIEARNAHVDILMIPAGENAATAQKYAGGARVIPVETFPQAVRALEKLPVKG